MINDVRAPPPVSEVAELSQIYGGLVCQHPGNIQTLPHVMALIAPLLNAIPNVVSFVKDVQAHYLTVDMILARRCGFKTVASLLSKASADVSPSAFGLGYTEQDMWVLCGGVTPHDQLEMHLYSGRGHGWCLAQKLALRDAQGQVIGMAGVSHDLQEAQAHHSAWQRLVVVDDRIRNYCRCPIVMEKLTALSDMPVVQIECYRKRIFHLTSRQMIHKVRSEEVIGLPAGGTPITDITLQCGYTDHSAFSRQSEAMTDSIPHDFRTTLVG